VIFFPPRVKMPFTLADNAAGCVNRCVILFR
jgi:hypothetical protein